jgi:hypothetical protein
VRNPITLPSPVDQARHALLLLGAPAPARLVVEVHAALFDGDLSVPALAALMRNRAPELCAALNTDLTAASGLVALPDWPLERRIVTPVGRRADALAMVIRVVEFLSLRPASPGPAGHRLMRSLAQDVPDGVESPDLAEAARVALAALDPALSAEEPVRVAALARAADLEQSQQLYGLAALPRQRAGE